MNETKKMNKTEETNKNVKKLADIANSEFQNSKIAQGIHQD